MRSITSRDVALQASALITLIFIIAYALLIWAWEFPAMGLLLGALLFGVCYIIIFQFTERFIYRKIKTIYRTIHVFQQGSNHKKIPNKNNSNSEGAIEKVNQDVMDWAEGKISEVQDLRQQDTFRREFIGNLAHELKTPVTSIQGYILTLLEGALDDPDNNHKFLRKAADGVDRISSLIEDLDAITQIEAGNFELDLAKMDIATLITDVYDSLESMANKGEMKLAFKRSSDKPILVQADKMRIFQVLTNLIVNSIKYGKPGGTIKAKIYDLSDNVLVEISDDGIGMDPQELPRIFERFYRVDRSRDRNRGGTGLGLAIVKHLVEAHDQTISVRSTINEGSTFSFTLAKA